jgi:superfamily II DNA or RNA helicase
MARGVIARTWLGEGEDERLGRFRLRPGQRALSARVRAALDEFGGALVVDPPGSGKTIIALAVARRFADVLVAAPATLRTQWERSAARAGVAVRFVTIESLSRGRSPPSTGLLIVDEAHHLRTPGTARHRAVARLAATARVLLLSATPVVNRRRDRDALLSLFLGARAERLGAHEAARCVLRQVVEAGPLPRLRRIAPIGPFGAIPSLATAIGELPPPLPLERGAAATPLIRMSLALAWSSSLAALDRALQRRIQRGAALRDVIAAGRQPSREALRHWLVTDEGTQLAFAEILAPIAGSPVADRRDVGAASMRASLPGARALTVLDTHLAAVRTCRELIAAQVGPDALARAEAIRSLAAAHPGRRILVFARHAETIGALFRALRTVSGVVAITGARVRAAAGRWTRDEVLAAVGAGAAPLDSGDPRAVRVLLATDLLAEGVELTGIGILVHADLPWTPARLDQRRGRVVRPGARAREIIETRIDAPLEARTIVRLGERLRRKRRAAEAVAQEPSAHARLAATMRRWATQGDRSRATAIEARERGFIAAIRTPGGTSLVGGREEPASGRWTVTSRLTAIARLTDAAEGPERPPDDREVRHAVRSISRFLAREHARTLLGGSTLRDGDTIARAARRLEAILARSRPIDRHRVAVVLRRLLANAEGGSAREVALGAELSLREELDDQGFIARLSALVAAGSSSRLARESRPRLVGLLLLTPSAPVSAAGSPAPSPPSASPGIVAPR